MAKKIQQTKGEKYKKYWPWKYMWPDRMSNQLSNTWQPMKSRLQNEILTASIAQEIKEDGYKTGGRKQAANANEETKGRAKGWGRKEFDEHVSWSHVETCVTCLEDDNEYMVYVSYIVAWARPL